VLAISAALVLSWGNVMRPVEYTRANHMMANTSPSAATRSSKMRARVSSTVPASPVYHRIASSNSGAITALLAQAASTIATNSAAQQRYSENAGGGVVCSIGFSTRSATTRYGFVAAKSCSI
jgi:hypothetical protein